jgi:hypothetical protein
MQALDMSQSPLMHEAASHDLDIELVEQMQHLGRQSA